MATKRLRFQSGNSLKGKGAVMGGATTASERGGEGIVISSAHHVRALVAVGLLLAVARRVEQRRSLPRRARRHGCCGCHHSNASIQDAPHERRSEYRLNRGQHFALIERGAY